ncbi:unnamed protein product, partial [Symbiodinium sp. KB8]
MTCLKCGKVGHRAANCPQKEQPQAQHADDASESAPFICFSEAALAAHGTGTDAMSTQEAMRKGWCVVDGGATRTLGSVVALQSVVDQNTAMTGKTKILNVDPSRRPTFSFGNSSENTCSSTIELGVQAKRSQSGHQLLPLCGDMFNHSAEAKQAVPSLRTICRDRIFHSPLEQQPNMTEKKQNMLDPKHDYRRLVRNMSINKMNKATLQANLRSHGEEPPESWTMIELRSRLAEVDPSLTEPAATGSNKTELQTWVQRINKARAKKANLIEVCRDEMGIEVTGNETIPVLERRALQRAHALATPAAADLVGFGKHAALEYQDINRYQPTCREWVLRTDSEESGCDYRLRRLAKWLRENPIKTDEDEAPIKPKATRKKTTTSSVVSSSAASSTTPSAAIDKDMVAILQNLTSAMQNLQEK